MDNYFENIQYILQNISNNLYDYKPPKEFETNTAPTQNEKAYTDDYNIEEGFDTLKDINEELTYDNNNAYSQQYNVYTNL